MKSLVNYAIAYAKAGMYVLPMIGKKPLIEFADKPAMTVEEIQDFWTKHPYANIALRTVNFFVVDVDRHENGADGFKSFDKVKSEHPEYFRETLSQTTAGNGKQYFYLKRENTDIQQLIGWLDGVDVKAHINNYVVVAPSTNNDRAYHWDNQNPIATAPKELVAAINSAAGKSNIDPELFKVWNKDKQSQTAELFEMITKGLGDTGGRNNALASFVGGLLFRNVSAEATYKLAKLANSNTPDCLSDKELDRTFDSMLKKETKRRKEANN